ncbi:MAG TPA: PilZ domain-containing protein [Janthinobacterium sp.]|nr:PilZ domain-containing protein [Janthinobacterium sp.]
MLVMDAMPAVAARTMDISAAGVAAMVADPVKVGQRGRITFEMYIDGKSHLIEASVSVTYCILGHDGFKVGFQFSNLDPAAVSAITKYMR